MKVLADHGLIGNKGPYYSIKRRKVVPRGVVTGFSSCTHLTPDGNILALYNQNGVGIWVVNGTTLEEVYYKQITPYANEKCTAWYDSIENRVYYIYNGVITKINAATGETIWTKTVTTSERDICGCSTGFFVATPYSIRKYSLTDGSLIWTSVPSMSYPPTSLQASDAGETYFIINHNLCKLNATGMSLSTLIDDGRTRHDSFYHRVFNGDNHYWVPDWLGGTMRYPLPAPSSTNGVELIASSSDLGRFINNDYNAMTIALGKSRIFIASRQGSILVFDRSTLNYLDKVPCYAYAVFANQNSDNFYTLGQDRLMTYYTL